MANKKKIRRERGANWEPKIRERKGRGSWVVDLGTKFDSRFIYCPTKEEAAAKAAEKKAEFLVRLTGQKQAEKEKVAFNWFNLNNTQQNHLATAFTTVHGDTDKLLRALRFYEKHTTTADASRRLADVSDEYIKAKTAAGKRPRTIRDAEGKIAPFVKSFGAQSISEITTADVEGWLNARDYSPGTRDAYRKAISGLFSHAIRRRYTEHNPAGAIEAVTVDQGLPTIHSVDQVKAILTAASNYVPQRYVVKERDSKGKVTDGGYRDVADQAKIFHARSLLVPYLAIGYFAGLRPENELVNLDWKDIDFEAKTIRVDPATAKKRRQRYVDMSDNLIQWLAPYVRSAGKIGFSRHAFREVRVEPKFDWSKDVMRHSFGSYLLAQNEDAPKTALQMGHTRVDVLFNHYRNLVKKSAAAEYWTITPSILTATT